MIAYNIKVLEIIVILDQILILPLNIKCRS